MKTEQEIRNELAILNIQIEIAKEKQEDFTIMELHTKINMLKWVLEDE